MKKFFTLIAAALVSLSVSAEKTPIQALGSDNNPIDFSAGWGFTCGAWGGNWFEQPNGDFDASGFEYLWITYEDATSAINFGITYKEWVATQSWGEQYEGVTKTLDEEGFTFIKLEKEKTITKGVGGDAPEFAGDTWDKHVINVYLQGTADEQSATITGIFFGTKADLDAAMEEAGIATKELPEDPTNELDPQEGFPETWEAGGKTWGHYWVHEWRDASAQTDDAALTEGDAWKCYVRSIDEARAAGNAVTTDGNPLAADGANFADWDSQFFIAWEKPLEKGETVMVIFSYFSDAAGEGVSVGTQTHGVPGGYIDWQGIGSITFGTEPQDFFSEEFEAGNGRVPAGTACIAFNLAKGTGFTAYFNNIEVWIKRFTPTGIQQEVYKQTPQGTIHRTYNMAGQLVNEDYKGLVIKNGKKYIQK